MRPLYPRVHGASRRINKTGYAAEPPPPHTRCRRLGPLTRSKVVPSTPACAGLTTGGAPTPWAHSLYSRIREADLMVHLIASLAEPLPPHTRG